MPHRFTFLSSVLILVLPCWTTTQDATEGNGVPTPDEARYHLRPSLVEVSMRSMTWIEKGDWKRASASLSTVLPLAEALDERWKTVLLDELRKASGAKNVNETSRAILRVVYWDTVDLVASIEDIEDLDPRKARTHLIKAELGVRFLAPVIEAAKIVDDEGNEIEGRIFLVRLRKNLKNAVNYLPSNREYGETPQWRTLLARDGKRFRATLKLVLPKLHGEPKGDPDLPKKKRDR